jgi:branched-chain amino acid transport system ATP-binding protein
MSAVPASHGPPAAASHGMPPLGAPLLAVHNLAVHYGDLVGIADVSLAVPASAVVALLGSNGAGKTTTLNAIAGLVPPAGGRVRWRDGDITGQPAYAIVGRGLALAPEGWHLFVQQTVEQNLRLGATVLADRRRVPALLDRVFTLFPRLAERRRQRAGTLSGGERQMLATGRALMSDPKLLMLDEPSLGLAPAVVEAMYATLQRLRGEGLTLLLAEQAVELALEVADFAYVLQTGRTVLQGKASDLADDRDVQRIYLGLETGG